MEPTQRTALVTGSPERVSAVGDALVAHGCDVIRVDDRAALATVCESLGPASVDHYVQLPVHVPSSGETVVSRFHALLSSGLLARFEDAAVVVGALRSNASIVLVSGNLPPAVTGPDDCEARLSLLRVLAQAIQADCAPARVRVVVADHAQTADEIAVIATDPIAAAISHAADQYPEMDYVDWRLEVLSLAAIES